MRLIVQRRMVCVTDQGIITLHPVTAKAFKFRRVPYFYFFCPQSTTTTILPGVTTMALPDISNLHINGNGYPTTRTTNASGIPIPEDIEDTRGDQYMEKLKQYAKSVPFSIEPYSQMLELLDFFLLRLTQSVEAKDFDIGFLQWDSMLT